ncbi:MAG: hypothetical protein PHC43_05290, partial [Candidatus Marinimicrobia bacterium]|nr:hypothetical protein [Candidatus Neomarinimicrobiota bacterium]
SSARLLPIMKKCPRCGEWKRLDEYCAYSNRCLVCNNYYMMLYRRNNREKIRNRNRKKLNQKPIPETRKCQICGIVFNPKSWNHYHCPNCTYKNKTNKRIKRQSPKMYIGKIMECPICGNKFKNPDGKTKYCSLVCKINARNQRFRKWARKCGIRDVNNMYARCSICGIRFKTKQKRVELNFFCDKCKFVSNARVRGALCAGLNISASDIPPELLMAKRQHLIVNRKLKEANYGI